jgi:uracil-DNA glycosylase
MSSLKMETSWKKYLSEETEKPYFKELKKFLVEEVKQGKTIYPKPQNIFNALKKTTFDNVKVVILGQDPYHGEGQAHGLSFSVPEKTPFPPSLQNIFKEIVNEYGGEIPKSGNLKNWASQGVLLLNATLTVEKGKAGSHKNKGWEEFTDQIIKTISKEKESIIFLLWGSHAQKKSIYIDIYKHIILKAPHPSPLSAYRGFFGCNHFIEVNNILKKQGKTEINWES